MNSLHILLRVSLLSILSTSVPYADEREPSSTLRVACLGIGMDASMRPAFRLNMVFTSQMDQVVRRSGFYIVTQSQGRETVQEEHGWREWHSRTIPRADSLDFPPLDESLEVHDSFYLARGEAFTHSRYVRFPRQTDLAEFYVWAMYDSDQGSKVSSSTLSNMLRFDRDDEGNWTLVSEDVRALNEDTVAGQRQASKSSRRDAHGTSEDLLQPETRETESHMKGSGEEANTPP